jgi:alpha-beta hydrolase superfamily lysophospholipase
LAFAFDKDSQQTGTIMQEDDFHLTSADGQRIAAYHWGRGVSPHAALVLSHGMGEHAKRYRPALRCLIEDGVDVYALDHRGHGATARAESERGNLGPGGFAALADDVAVLTGVAKKENPGVPIILLGHSMGSMVAQLSTMKHSDLIDGLALSGTAAVDHVAMAAARNPNLFAAMNASFEPARTPFDWLSRNTQEVDAYIADPLCGFPLKPESFASMLGFGSLLADPAQLANIRKSLPVYVFSGDYDPLNRDLHALQPVIDRYRAVGLNVAVDIYPQARHEILNETNRAQVVRALLSWINQVVARCARK